MAHLQDGFPRPLDLPVVGHRRLSLIDTSRSILHLSNRVVEATEDAEAGAVHTGSEIRTIRPAPRVGIHIKIGSMVIKIGNTLRQGGAAVAVEAVVVTTEVVVVANNNISLGTSGATMEDMDDIDGIDWLR